MSESRTDPGGALEARLVRAIEAWCAWAFGVAVYGDRGFVASLRSGRCPRPRTADRALAVTGEPPAGPAFPGEVDDCLAATAIKRPLPGREATGNPYFVAQRLGGVCAGNGAALWTSP
ncbi:MAG: hypothetical protein OXQ29_07955 [Rhodospirillaceae bacterium]|nr:hypothetical protein [Rhodospirillaceae bacterium]